MTVTDPDVPDPLNDPRTLQADPGAYAQGADLASTEDDDVATGEELMAEERPEARSDLAAGQNPAGDAEGGGVTGGGVTGGGVTGGGVTSRASFEAPTP